MNPVVSVIIRTINRPTLERAIDSVLRQSYRPIELVLIDALGSNLLQKPQIESSGVEVVVWSGAKKLGYGEAANAGLDHSHGDYIVFLDDDDFHDADHIATLMEAIRSHPESLLAYSGTRAIDANGQETGVMSRRFSPMRLYQHNPAQIGAVLFSRKLVDKGCRFDTVLAVFEDWDFWLQASCHTDFTFTGRVTNNWMAGGGGSGVGVGANFDPEKNQLMRARLAGKWQAQFERLVAEFNSHVETGRAAHLNGDRGLAEYHYRQALRLDGEDATTLNLLAMVLFEAGRLDEAGKTLNAAIASEPGNPDWRFNRALVLRARGNIPGALRALEELLAVTPQYDRAVRMRTELAHMPEKSRPSSKLY